MAEGDKEKQIGKLSSVSLFPYKSSKISFDKGCYQLLVSVY